MKRYADQIRSDTDIQGTALALPASIRNAVGVALIALSTGCAGKQTPESAPLQEAGTAQEPQYGTIEISESDGPEDIPGKDHDSNDLPLAEAIEYGDEVYEGVRKARDGFLNYFHVDAENLQPLYSERYYSVGNFHQNRAWVIEDGMDFGTPDIIGDYFHIKPDGQRAYPENYNEAGDFHEGRAWVREGDIFEYKVEGPRKDYIVPLDSRSLRDSWERIKKEKASFVRYIRGEYFHIDPYGQPVYPQRYEFAGDYSEGLAPVKLNGQSYHIELDGSPAYPARYQGRFGPFKNGRAPLITCCPLKIAGDVTRDGKLHPKEEK